MFGLKRWWHRRLLRRAALPEAAWRDALAAVPALRGLSEVETRRLRDHVVIFLHEKDIHGAGGLELSGPMRVRIAVEACLPILELDHDWYSGWVSIVVYPDEFVPAGEYADDAGIVHAGHGPLAGEAWEQGPILLSWSDVAHGDAEGSVIVHECAHKLDMLNGTANGMPPLHRDMDPREWSGIFTRAYVDFGAAVQRDGEDEIDPYGAESPAEFFSVMSETFFCAPRVLRRRFAEIYDQLARFYRQDPLNRS